MTEFGPGGREGEFDFTHMDTGVPAVPGPYSTSDIFGFSAPGIAVQIQVAFRPAK
jgi:hypothetical protein